MSNKILPRLFLTGISVLALSFPIYLPEVTPAVSVAWANPKHQYSTDIFSVNSGGYRLHLSRTQMRTGNSGRDILLIHGVTYSSHEFDVDYADYSLVKYLARHGYGVWCLDIAGFGESDSVQDGFLPDSDYASEDIHAAAEFIMKQNGGKPIDLLGWSWGTVTSSRFAAKYPQLVHRLVLYAPIVAGLGDAQVNESFHHNTWEHAADDFQKTPSGKIDFTIVEKTVADAFLANAWRYDKETSPNGGRRDLMVAAEKRLIPTKDIKMPVLVIAGSKDPYVSPDLCQEAYEGLGDRKNSQIVVIDGASHVMMLEKPYYKLFQKAVKKFLEVDDE